MAAAVQIDFHEYHVSFAMPTSALEGGAHATAWEGSSGSETAQGKSCRRRCKEKGATGYPLRLIVYSAKLLLQRKFALFDEVFSDLDGIECGTLLDLIADEPEGDAVRVCKILADTAYEYIVTILVEQRHRV